MESIIYTRIDKQTKQQAEELSKSMNLTLNEAIRLFIDETIRIKGFPFRPSLVPNKDSETFNETKFNTQK